MYNKWRRFRHPTNFGGHLQLKECATFLRLHLSNHQFVFSGKFRKSGIYQLVGKNGYLFGYLIKFLARSLATKVDTSASQSGNRLTGKPNNTGHVKFPSFTNSSKLSVKKKCNDRDATLCISRSSTKNKFMTALSHFSPLSGTGDIRGMYKRLVQPYSW